MIDLFTGLAAFMTRSEGRKFLKLKDTPDSSILLESPENRKKETSLYIHIPFCKSLCPFCCFNR